MPTSPLHASSYPHNHTHLPPLTPSPRLTHEEEIDLRGQQLLAVRQGKQDKDELADLGQGQAHAGRHLEPVPKHEHHAANLDGGEGGSGWG